MAERYVDATRPDDTGDGLSEATAKKTIAAGYALCAAGDRLNVKASGTYTLTATVNVTVAGTVAAGRVTIQGYSATIGDGGKPTITSATNGVALFTMNAAHFTTFKDLVLTHTAATRGDAVATVTAASTDARFENLTIDGCAVGLDGTTRFTSYAAVNCEIKNCTSHGISADGGGELSLVSGCYIHDNAGHGVATLTSGTARYELVRNIIESNGGRGFYDSATSRTQVHKFYDNTFYNNANSGIDIAATTGSATLALVNNVLANNGAYGIKVDDAAAETDARVLVQKKNAFYNNTSGARSGMTAAADDISLSDNPFTDAPNGDFSLNNVAGAGAALRSAAFPGAFPGGLTTGYGDVGAAETVRPTPAQIAAAIWTTAGRSLS